MFKQSVLCCALIFLFINQSSRAVEICSNDSPNWTKVMSGEYHVSNNVWGDTSGRGDQCLDIDLESTYFKVTLSTHNSSSVVSYPFIRKGNHWGNRTDDPWNPFPIKVGELDTAPFTWSVDTTGVGGVWNAAFEAWFSLPGTDFPDGGAELMIWINYGGGAGPGGSKVATVDIGGYTWDVYYALWGWNYIAYKLVPPANQVSLDLKDFVHDALTRGYLLTTWDLDNMEAGFEIWRDGQGLTCNYFTADATGGAEPVDYPPVAFNLSSPSNNRNLTSWSIPFRWQASLDPNAQPIEYILHIFGDGLDTTVARIDTTTFTYDATNNLQPATYYTWYVEATDSADTTASATQRTFKTPSSTAVDLTTKQYPARFSLAQNYPNPFNPRTIISYSLPQASYVTLKVYDTLGREIVTLADNLKKGAGNYEVSFDASNLPSGVYLCRLQADKFVTTRKMMLIK